MGCCVSIDEEVVRPTTPRKPETPRETGKRQSTGDHPVASINDIIGSSTSSSQHQRVASGGGSGAASVGDSKRSNGSAPGSQVGTSVGHSDAGRVIISVGHHSGTGTTELSVDASLREFSFKELEKATKGFRDDGKLGEGGFGSVYKGTIDANTSGGGQKVAIKMLTLDGTQGDQEWMAEVRYLGELRHPNLVRLVGYCAEDMQRLLVYEFMEYGSLERYLFSRTRDPLPWDIRMKVALHAARGLAFLHEETEPQVIYRDFKTSNILVDREFNAKLSDFGLARDGPQGGNTHVSTRVMGTFGYAAPEYVLTGHLTAKSDIYSFGVVLLEMIGGRKAMEQQLPKSEQNIIDWARPYFRDRSQLPRLLDKRIVAAAQAKQQPMPLAKAVAKAAVIAQCCVKVEPKERPAMSDVVRSLEAVLQMSMPAAPPAAGGT
ncbi:unnamed protein product [Closterium sp. Yama58-4]|nr:unnamed protein product [Closterium sp. Yama58-4]